MKGQSRKYLGDMSWVSLDGSWSCDAPNDLVFDGGEYDPPPAKETLPETSELRDRFIIFGTVLFDQRFREGSISVQVEFDAVDYRSDAGIVIQYDTSSKDMLNFGVTGGGIKYRPGVTGFMYKLRSWGPPFDQRRNQQSTGPGAAGKAWTSLFEVGFGSNLQAQRTYNLNVSVRGSVVTLFVDGVEIGKHTLPISSLPGFPCGLFAGSHTKIRFRNVTLEPVTPRAFVVMQFDTPEYEALFRDVIAPACEAEGLQPYRADFTYMPGLVIEDIKKQISEAKLVIAEITPANPNVYYEIGYADALNKPMILISDKREGMKPFDVRAYRTIFYENSIGGKSKVDKDLREYLKLAMGE